MTDKKQEVEAVSAAPDLKKHPSVTPSVSTRPTVTASTRVPMYKQKKTLHTSRPGMVTRLVNEEPGRVEMFMAAGWVPAAKDANDPDSFRSQDATDGSSIARRVVNSGRDAKASTAIVMEMPIEWYQEDTEAKLRDRNMKSKTADDVSKTNQFQKNPNGVTQYDPTKQ